MAFSEKELSEVEKIIRDFCEKRNHPDYIDQVRLDFSIHGQDIEIYEERPYWRDPSEKTQTSIAKIKYVRSQDEWRLYWMGGNLKWQLYEPFSVSKYPEKIVDEIDRDEFGCFFG